ncbi:hypothetical protein QRQ56_03160 [Bradyrhizobium sp. U531]|uniref:GTP pyrophosphokinase n=1 Tax=Bradyrhizobium sp. U531 TaxID=3053458 RepID=UPI003F43549A
MRDSESKGAQAGQDETRLTEPDRQKIAQDYSRNYARYEGLLEEVLFILHDRIAAADIKVHTTEKRIKKLVSVTQKCERKGLNDLDGLVDLVGARVVCLFRSDLSKVGAVIRENFEVLDVDDKISEGGPLGYMSIHYVCRMPERYNGPRYENTRGVRFEIQVRTLCMHAWAAVSHYLDYKGEWDVPEELKLALSALGGLFYVADSEFEQFYSARTQSKLAAEKNSPKKYREINLDTVKSYLEQKFPNRKHSDFSVVSKLVQEIKKAEYGSIEEVDRDLERGRLALNAFEGNYHTQLADVGAVRVTLSVVSDKFRAAKRVTSVDLTEYERLVSPVET